eukprot:CAMPEP_0185802700 /NCGR_PEP_ID=MMETSP1322-20130828/2141_1 /TAXON_ID=265543 /ORGANISM="Minutocellus polymorphus, Strain RCC2270" /LENGTH=31 /DNA_ID= /DNA_START= /DNA_END= /DNA_ORIENTATION=
MTSRRAPKIEEGHGGDYEADLSHDRLMAGVM